MLSGFEIIKASETSLAVQYARATLLVYIYRKDSDIALAFARVTLLVCPKSRRTPDVLALFVKGFSK
jgi:hypothetical protein